MLSTAHVALHKTRYLRTIVVEEQWFGWKCYFTGGWTSPTAPKSNGEVAGLGLGLVLGWVECCESACIASVIIFNLRKFASDFQIRNFVVSHKFVIKFPQLAYQAWKMPDAAYGHILSLPIVHYIQIEQIMANCDGNIYWNDVILDVDRCPRPLWLLGELSVSNRVILICFKPWKNAVYRRTSVPFYCVFKS